MTLSVLAAYRGNGIASKLLSTLEAHVNTIENINDIFLHVQTNNDEAIDFYKHRGYKISKTVPDYYTRLEPKAAYELTKIMSGVSLS
jgi:N-alpha-acetyltransferase 50